MADLEFDLVIIGAGSGGLTAAGFAAQLGAKVALVEKGNIGGDCTWSGCVPSKALLKAAKIAHAVRSAGRFGISANPPVADMPKVRDYVAQAIQKVYSAETPDELRRKGIEVIPGTGRFIDSHAIAVNSKLVRSKTFLLTTGAKPYLPSITGLHEVPFVTYEKIFDNHRLPNAMIVVGGGPIGMEIAQAYQRLGSQVSVVADQILPRDEPDVRQVIQAVLEREGVRFVWGRANAVRKAGNEIVVTAGEGEVRGDFLFVACGRKPSVADLGLDKAGVMYSDKGILVEDQLRTNVKHIYAAGDVLGGYQFTHLAGWQAFQAARNALLPGSSVGLTDLVPWVTFTDPEVAHVGLTEEQARTQYGKNTKTHRWEMSRTDRAVCEGQCDGFIKITTKKNGTILGATMVCPRAGEAITEIIIAMKHNLTISDLAGTMHAYPTYSTAIQQLAAEIATQNTLSGVSGRLIRGLSKFIR